jgi:hypothetical protein
MVRYSFLVGLFHPQLHAGLSRRLHSLTVAARKRSVPIPSRARQQAVPYPKRAQVIFLSDLNSRGRPQEFGVSALQTRVSRQLL